MSAAAPSPRRIQSWQRLREATEHRALFSVERAYALDGARLVARHRKGDPVWPPRPRQRVRLGLVMCGLVPELVALLLLAHERGRRAVVITFAELAELAGVSQRTAYNAVREAERIGYLVVRPWFDVLNTPAGAAERTTASGVPLKHWQRASAYIPGPALLAGLARQAQLRGVNARVVEAKAAAGPTERTSSPGARPHAREDRNGCDPTALSDPERTTVDVRVARRMPPEVSVRPPAAADRRARKQAALDGLCARSLARAAWLARFAPLPPRPATPAQQGGVSSDAAPLAPGEAHHSEPEPAGEPESTAPSIDEGPLVRARDGQRWTPPPPALFELLLRFERDEGPGGAAPATGHRREPPKSR